MTRSPAPLTEALERLDAALGNVVRELLAADGTRGMTDDQILALAPIAESIGRRSDALRVSIAGEIGNRSRPERGESRLSARNGCANAAELITRLSGVATSTAKDRLNLADSIASITNIYGDTFPARFPVVRDGLVRGTIGVDSALAITRTLGPLADRADTALFRAAEDELVAAASGEGCDTDIPVSADETVVQAKVWALVLDPDGELPEYERAMRKRSVVLGRERDGLVPLRGGLLPDVAAQFKKLVDAYLNPRVEDRTLPSTGPTFVEVDTGEGDGPVVPDEPRSRGQKMHDVLASVLGVAARAAETPTLGGAAPTLLVTISAADLEQHEGIAFVEGTDCTVPAFVARHIACCGGIQRLVLGDDGRVIELGSPQRVFTPHQRRAITARDGGCIVPGCDVGASWCEVHHVIRHADGGPTHTDNGVLLCWYHHRTLETSGWYIRMIDGMPHTKAPHSVDPYGRWRPATGSRHRRHERLRRRVAQA